MKKKVLKLVKHPLFSGSAIMIFGSLGVNGINYVYHLVMGRVLGPENYGILASLFSLLYIVSVVPTSASFAIVKFISSAETRKEREKIFLRIRNLLRQIAGAGFIILLVGAPFVAKFLHISNILSVILVAPILFVSLMTLVNQATFQGMLKFVENVMAQLISSLGKLIVGLTLVLAGASVTGAMGGVLIAASLAYLFTQIKIKKYFQLKLKTDYKLNKFLEYAFPVLVQALAFTSFFTADVILVKHFLPAFDAGLYAALSTLGKIIFFATQPVTSVMFPIVSGKRSRGEAYKDVFLGAFFLTIFISIGIVSFYRLFPNLAIGILFGEQYLKAAHELVWMGGFMAIYTASYVVVNFLLSINKTKIVILPLLAAAGQIIGIWLFHGSILQVIQVGLIAAAGLFASLALYLVRWQFRRVYAKE